MLDILYFLLGFSLGILLGIILGLVIFNKYKKSFTSMSEEALLKNAESLNNSLRQNMEYWQKNGENDRALSRDNLLNIVVPLKDALGAVDKKIIELERLREGAYVGLKEQISTLIKCQSELQKETTNLSKSFSVPSIRGRWGEMQLKRVVELSGLSAQCDFTEQLTIKDSDDNFRPDLIVTLPKNKKIIIDAKAPWQSYFNDDDRPEKSKALELALAIKRHLTELKKKSYAKILKESPEFIVMFLPIESFLSRALTADPMLIDFAAQNNVILATPTSLIALLKSISFSFREEAVANNINEVRKLAEQLIDKIKKVSEDFEKLGKHLRQAAECYNQASFSLEEKVLNTARKLAEIKNQGQIKEPNDEEKIPKSSLIINNQDAI